MTEPQPGVPTSIEHSCRAIAQGEETYETPHTSTFEQFYRAHYTSALSYVRVWAPDSDPEGVVAEAFLLVWRRFRSSGELSRPWLFAVLRNKIGDHYRVRKRRRHFTIDVDNLEVRTARTPATDPSDRIMIEKALRALTKDHLEALVLTYWIQLNATEAAEVTGTTAAAFRKRLSRARNALLEALTGRRDGTSTRKEWLQWIESNS